MVTILDYSSALDYSIMRHYTNIVYYYYSGSTLQIQYNLDVVLYQLFMIVSNSQ